MERHGEVVPWELGAFDGVCDDGLSQLYDAIGEDGEQEDGTPCHFESWGEGDAVGLDEQGEGNKASEEEKGCSPC